MMKNSKICSNLLFGFLFIGVVNFSCQKKSESFDSDIEKSVTNETSNVVSKTVRISDEKKLITYEYEVKGINIDMVDSTCKLLSSSMLVGISEEVAEEINQKRVSQSNKEIDSLITIDLKISYSDDFLKSYSKTFRGEYFSIVAVDELKFKQGYSEPTVVGAQINLSSITAAPGNGWAKVQIINTTNRWGICCFCNQGCANYQIYKDWNHSYGQELHYWNAGCGLVTLSPEFVTDDYIRHPCIGPNNNLSRIGGGSMICGNPGYHQKFIAVLYYYSCF